MVPDNGNRPLGLFAGALSKQRVIGNEVEGEAHKVILPTKHKRKITFEGK